MVVRRRAFVVGHGAEIWGVPSGSPNLQGRNKGCYSMLRVRKGAMRAAGAGLLVRYHSPTLFIHFFSGLP